MYCTTAPGVNPIAANTYIYIHIYIYLFFIYICMYLRNMRTAYEAALDYRSIRQKWFCIFMSGGAKFMLTEK